MEATLLVQPGDPSIPSIGQQIKVERLQPGNETAWDRFVFCHFQASPFHTIAWKRTIEESFGYEAYYLYARVNDKIRGILPLFLVANPVLGRALISSPFAVYGGILADAEPARTALYTAAKELGRAKKVDYVEFRNRFPEQCVGEPNVSRYVGFVRPVFPDESALLASLPKKTRNIVRKSLSQSFTVRYGVDTPRILDAVHAKNMHRLGTPNFPLKYFCALLRNFGSLADIREVWINSRPAAVSLNFFFREEMHTYHAAADASLNHLAPNTFMYFDHLRWAGNHGYGTFDFGRCKVNTGVYDFKSHWGTTVRTLPYEIALIRRGELPNLSPANPKFNRAISAWQKLPLPVARLLSRLTLPLFP